MNNGGEKKEDTQRAWVTHIMKEGNVLFNYTLNTFFIYGYMASDM